MNFENRNSKFSIFHITFVISLFSFLFAQNSFSQSITFQHTYGGASHDHGRSVKQTFDGGYIVAGSTSSFGNGNSDVYLLKLDSFGIKQWSSVFGGPNVDWGFSVVQTADSGYVVCGYTNSFGAGGYDIYLIKADQSGNLLWSKTFGGSDWDFAYSMSQASDGGFIIAGETYSFGNGNKDVYLIKTDSSGDEQWSKTYGGNEDDYAKSVKPTFDGGYIIGGGTKSFGAGETDIWLINTLANGDSSWTRTFGDTLDDIANSVAQAPSDSGYIMVGSSLSFSTTGKPDYYMVRTDRDGNPLWTDVVTAFQNEDYHADVKPLADGRFALLGSTKSIGTIGYVFQFMIAESWGGIIMGIGGPYGSLYNNELSFSLDTTSDKGFVLCGSTDGYGAGYNDIFLVKVDSMGHTDIDTVLSFSDTVAVALHEPEKDDFHLLVYPNPVSDFSYIGFSETCGSDGIYEMVIYDIFGKEVKHYPEVSGPFRISASEFRGGMYLVKIISSEKTHFRKFLVLSPQ